MPSFELSKLQAVTGPRALSEADRSQIDARAAKNNAAPVNAPTDGGISIEVGAGIETASPPINQDRVAEIRAALEDGSYPLVPTEIADAMIAAQLSFRIEQ